jgi:hypothetical protein
LVCDFPEELERAWVGNIVSLKNACRNPTPSDLVLCSLLEKKLKGWKFSFKRDAILIRVWRNQQDKREFEKTKS